MPRYANRVSSFGTTIFTEINNLAREHQAVNLGQGMPDFDGPQMAIDAMVEALRSGTANQYAPGPGVLELREGIARHARAFYNLDVDPKDMVLVTPGGTEAILLLDHGAGGRGRRGGHHRTLLRQLRTGRHHGGRDAGLRAAAPAGVGPSTRTNCGRPSAQRPRRSSSTRRTTPPGASSPAPN